MKRFIMTITLFLVISSIWGIYVIPRTITVDSLTLSALRNSLSPASPAYDPYIADLSDSDDNVIPLGGDLLSTSDVPDYVEEMSRAVILHLQDALFVENWNTGTVQQIVNILANSIPADTSSALAYFQTPTDCLVRALQFSYYTQNAAMLYDCLYYAPAANVPDSIKTKLRDILYATIRLTMNSIDSYSDLPDVQQREWGIGIPDDHEYPGFSIIQYRLQMLAASGLAALLLKETVPAWMNEMNEHLDYVNDVLFQQAMPSTFPSNEQFQGMLALHTGKSGAYIEGLEYQSFVLQNLSLFFTAYKRLSIGSVNYFNNQYYVAWINDLIAKGVPTGADWPYNDNHGKNWVSPGPIIFYYNNISNPELREKCAWYYKQKYGSNSTNYSYSTSGRLSCPSNLLVKYLSDPFILPRISSINSVPSFISRGSLSNSEFTILRKPIAGDISAAISGVNEVASMYILHENSFAPYHDQSDHLSYSLYYKGKPFLIDPGYTVGTVPVSVSNPDSIKTWHYGREWMRSIYAHNMVVVDPDYQKELTELRHRYWRFEGIAYEGLAGAYRPYSPFSRYNEAIVDQDDIVRDPSFRDYFQHSDQLSMLRTRVVYDDVVTNLPKAKLMRYFIRYGDLFLVCDDIEALDDNLHEYSSLYQFGVFNSCSASVDHTAYGFVIQKGADIVDMVCGSTGDYENLLDGNSNGFDEAIFPTSYRFKSSPDTPNSDNKYGHLRGRTKVIDASDTSILALIAPRDTSNPIVMQSTTHQIDDYFGVKVSQNTSSIPDIPVTRYFGTTNGSQQSMILGHDEIETDAKLFAVSVINGVQPFVLDQSMVLLEGSSLRYEGIDLFQRFSGNDRGVTASYTDSALNVVFHGIALSHPKFKVYRSGTDPDQFTATQNTRFENHVPVPFVYDIPENRYPSTDVIQSLAYDNQYFYVNYSWSDLEAENLIDENLIFAKGEIPSTTLRSTLNIDGEVKITGTIVVRWDTTLNIKENSIVFISDDVNIFNQGTININGIESAPILITAATQAWGSILNVVGSTFICDWAVIEKASTGIMLRGIGQVTNSEIRNCDYGISIVTGTPFEIENNKIHLNTYGLSVSNSYTVSSLAHIAFNEICNNSFGILLYNSNPKMAGNDIHQNTIAGIQLVHASEPILEKNHIRNTGNNGMARPEILLESDSYPILDYGYNDINTDGFGYALYYDNIAGALPLRTLARENYWGSTNAIAIRHSIQPTSWNVIYSPFSPGPNTFFFNVDPNVFQQALIAEDEGDIVLAKQLYTSIVTTEPNSLYAVQSLGRLNSLYCKSPAQVGDLRFLYDSYLSTCSDNVLVQSATNKKIMLDRFDGFFDSAIQQYEHELLKCNSEMDSLLCLLDIAYTMQEMYYADQSKGAYMVNSYHAHGLNISSLKDAEQEIEQLWEAIMLKSDSTDSNQVPVPTKLELSNYPNPFNPSTTISFTLPETGAVKMSIYNTRGQLVKDLIKEEMERGFHEIVWDGKNNNGFTVGTGMYFVRIETNKNSKSIKILLMK